MNKEITIITGGSSGLGFELALKHYINGDNICILGRSKGKLDAAVAKLKATDSKEESNILPLTCNVGQESEVAEVFKTCLESYTIKTVYNVAGIGAVGNPEDIDGELISQLLEANFIGLILISTYALRAMKKHGCGSIVNIMSTVSKRANPREALYCGVKWGARGYTESLQESVKGSGIDVVAVYPGGMVTEFWNQQHVISPDISNFMNPAEVADMIFHNTTARESLKLSEIVIVRK